MSDNKTRVSIMNILRENEKINSSIDKASMIL